MVWEYWPGYLPPYHLGLLQRDQRREMISANTYVDSCEVLKSTTGLRCFLCLVTAGQEAPNDFPDPAKPGKYLTTRNASFREQSTWVQLPCCKEPFHRGCLVDMHRVRCRNRADWGVPLPVTCPLCGRKVLDSEDDIAHADRLGRIRRFCKYLMSQPVDYQGQAMPPGHKLHGDHLATFIGMCYISELEGGSWEAGLSSSKIIATAVQLRMVDLHGKAFYCRGQMWGEMMAAVNEATRKLWKASVGGAIMSGGLVDEVYDLFVKALRTALDGYQTATWHYHRLRVGE